MKVVHLFERSAEEAAKIIKQLEAKMEDVNKQIKDIKSKGGSFGNSPVAPQYEGVYKKLVAERKAIAEKIRIEKERSGSTEKGREWEKKHSEEHSDPEKNKERHNKAKSVGMNKANQLRSEHGDWKGLAKHVKAKVDAMTSNGTEKLHTDQIDKLTDELGITPRTLYKWLERPEFRSVRKNLPSEW